MPTEFWVVDGVVDERLRGRTECVHGRDHLTFEFVKRRNVRSGDVEVDVEIAFEEAVRLLARGLQLALLEIE